MAKNYKITVLDAEPKAATKKAGGSSSSSSAKKSIRIDFTPIGIKTPTWKYVKGTPQWAIDAAQAIGYEVEEI